MDFNEAAWRCKRHLDTSLQAKEVRVGDSSLREGIFAQTASRFEASVLLKLANSTVFLPLNFFPVLLILPLWSFTLSAASIVCSFLTM
jgi:hypothetical protein